MTSFDNVSGYPLSWPVTQQRTRSRTRSSFAATSVSRELRNLFAELGRLGCGDWNVIVSSNVELRRDGLPYSNRRPPDDPGVAVYFKVGGEPRVLACDRWDLVEHNLRAIVKHIEAMRGMERWGVGTRDQAFAGYKALPAPGAGRMWFEVLGFSSEANVDLDTARARYRHQARQLHPDTGGDQAAMAELNEAWRRCQEAFSA